MALMSAHNRRFSPWVLVIVAVAIVVLFSIGGGLVNAFYSCLVNLDITTSSCSVGPYQAGLAFLSLASLASLSWFVLLIIFLVFRPPPPPVQYSMNPTPGQFTAGNFASTTQPQAQTYYGAQGQQPQQAQQQYYGAQVQFPAPVVPNKEGPYVTVEPHAA